MVSEEARESYPHEIVHEVESNSEADMASNVQRVIAWSAQWAADHEGGEEDEDV